MTPEDKKILEKYNKMPDINPRTPVDLKEVRTYGIIIIVFALAVIGTSVWVNQSIGELVQDATIHDQNIANNLLNATRSLDERCELAQMFGNFIRSNIYADKAKDALKELQLQCMDIEQKEANP